jgi:hypothetical protein
VAVLLLLLLLQGLLPGARQLRRLPVSAGDSFWGAAAEALESSEFQGSGQSLLTGYVQPICNH